HAPARAAARRAHQGGGRRRQVRDPRHGAPGGGGGGGLPRRLQRPARDPGPGRPGPRHAGGRAAGRALRGGGDGGARHVPRHPRVERGRLSRLWRVREARTVVILLLEIAFFTWYLWPEAGRSHPFLNGANALLILKYSSIYGIAAVGAAMVIISGGVDLSPGAVIALAGVVAGKLFVEAGHSLAPSLVAGVGVGVVAG